MGLALVAGKKRVPMPATGKTALRIFLGIDDLLVLIESYSLAKAHEIAKSQASKRKKLRKSKRNNQSIKA